MKSTINTNANSLKSPKKILVVGDWVVDEYWVTGIHRSPNASRIGQAHFRALHPLNGSIQSFCGAGLTASILSGTKKNKKEFCEIHGVGIWHSEDTYTLTAMLNKKIFSNEQTPYRISNPNIATKSNNILFNLGSILPTLKTQYGTTRVIRIYQNTREIVELLQRIDWELPFPDDQNAWIVEKNRNNLNNPNLREFINQEFDAIVIKDLCKGVVSNSLIEWLIYEFEKKATVNKNIPWFISTKAWQPEWLDKLKHSNVRLIVIPQIATQRAMTQERTSCWITRSDNPSKEALENMQKIGSLIKSRPIIIALPEGSKMIAANFIEKNDRIGYIQTKSELESLPVDVPMASVLFPAVIANILNNENIDMETLLKKSLHYTQEWMKFESSRIEKPEEWLSDKVPCLNLNSSQNDLSVGKWKLFNWDIAKNEWNQAFSKYGIITKKSAMPLKNSPQIKGLSSQDNQSFKITKSIELWRSMIEIDGYVSCIKPKKIILQTLVEELKCFRNKGKKNHISSMLIATPGAGKTFLVRQLAKTLGFRYLPFNITQMLSKRDILDCLDSIVTTQAQNRDESILVFIDEVNAMLESQHVYDTFLAPLEEGIYVRAGKTFHIDPCVWLFAGTESPVKENDPLRDKSTKASDFVSRLTIPPQNIRFDNIDDENARVEKVYLGVTLLRSYFPDVRTVSEKVLQMFHSLPITLGIRELTHFVKSFVDIQYGKVLSKNVPLNWLSDKKVDIINWGDDPEGSMVEIN